MIVFFPLDAGRLIDQTRVLIGKTLDSRCTTLFFLLCEI